MKSPPTTKLNSTQTTTKSSSESVSQTPTTTLAKVEIQIMVKMETRYRENKKYPIAKSQFIKFLKKGKQTDAGSKTKHSGIEQKEPVKRKLNWKMSSSRGSQTLRLVYLCPTIIPQLIPFVPILSKMRLILESNRSLDQRSPRNTEKGAPTTTSTHQYMATTAKERRRTN